MAISWLSPFLSGGTTVSEPEELDISTGGQRSVTYSLTKSTATVNLKCPTADADEIALDLVVHRTVWPYRPDGNMRCTGATISPFAGERATDGYGIDYETSIITATYGTEDADKKEGQPGGPGGTIGPALFTETLTTTSEHLKLPVSKPGPYFPKDPDSITPLFRWGDAAIGADTLTGRALTEDEAPGRLAIGLEYTVKWTGLDDIPIGLVSLNEHVNGTTIVTNMGIGFAPGQMLYTGAQIGRTVTPTPTANLFDVSVKFLVRFAGWNTFWQASKGGWNHIVYAEAELGHGAGDIYLNFEEADFASLLP